MNVLCLQLTDEQLCIFCSCDNLAVIFGVSANHYWHDSICQWFCTNPRL